MRIVTVRRISQVFFFSLFLWFCVVSSLGVQWWQLRGWPVSWFLQLDPLVALGNVLTTGTLYGDLSWALVTIVLTVLLGRFFCSWVCPFGSLHHFVGYLGKRGKPVSRKVAENRYNRVQSIKYYLLAFLLAAAAGALMSRLIRFSAQSSIALWSLAIASAGISALALIKSSWKVRKASGVLLLLLGFWTALAFFFSVDRLIGASLQTGLLDPIPLIYRSVNLMLLPVAHAGLQDISVNQRYYDGAWFIGIVFLSAVLLNLKVPRFYCRYVCPLGALYGVLGRFALWRIGKTSHECVQCGLCEKDCEGGCNPSGSIRISECVLCMNCMHDCAHDLMNYRLFPSASGEITSPDVTRRGIILCLASGVIAVPVVRLNGGMASNWNSALIRPPGALPEGDFLSRCLKCGQCMRVCPTNIIQPCGIEGGLEGLWTPVLNFRIGTSGCQLNCVACGHVCPTAAIRPLSLDEKRGQNVFSGTGPMRLGTAFVDRGRCLPWAMDKPCIVCQENCPVSPKAIFVQESFNTVRGGIFSVKRADGSVMELEGSKIRPGQFATGDYFARIATAANGPRHPIASNTEESIHLRSSQSLQSAPVPGTVVEIQVRLQRPQVDLERCIGCGICEHECPVSGTRAIRVSAENESRSRKRSLLL